MSRSRVNTLVGEDSYEMRSVPAEVLERMLLLFKLSESSSETAVGRCDREDQTVGSLLSSSKERMGQ